MAPDLTLKVSNRARKGAIRKLPESITVPSNATVEDVKKIIAKEARVGDFNRVGIFDPQTKKILKDRTTKIGAEASVASAGEFLVQDLGLQLGWRTVFLIEYAGPIGVHALFYYLRSHISIPLFYVDAANTPMTQRQNLLYILFQLHFIKRELETAFLHKFAANTMPAWNVIRNSFLYWAEFGLLSALSIYATWSPLRFPTVAQSGLTLLDIIGLFMWTTGELCNYVVHQHLASLRRPGTTEKGIPSCIGSSLVTCPNYMFEILSWLGVILISGDLAVVISLLSGAWYMKGWSIDKERDLRKRFPDRYKKKRYTMLPGIL